MQDALVQEIEIQKEGVKVIESDSDEEALDIYGNPLNVSDEIQIENENDEDENEENKKKPITRCIFHPFVLVFVCLFVPIIITLTVVFVLKVRKKCGDQCIFIWDKGGWFTISMIILFFCDVSFLIIGIIYRYHLDSKTNKRCCSKRGRRYYHEGKKEKNAFDLAVESVLECEYEEFEVFNGIEVEGDGFCESGSESFEESK